MAKLYFQNHVKGAPPKSCWQKRQDFKYERKKTIIKIEDTPRVKELSHLTGEKRTPHWVINIYARRDADCKHPLISSTQSITGAQLGEALAYMILDLHGKLEYNPVALAKAITKAVTDAWEKRMEDMGA